MFIIFILKCFLLFSQVPNDNCNSAISIGVATNCNNPVSGSSNGATQSFSGCVGNADDDVWYKFTATHTTHIITIIPSSNYDPVVELFSGNCSNLVSLYCRDNGFTGEQEVIYATNLTINQTYYIRVYHYYSGAGSGNFSICVTSPPNPPVNDNCDNATVLVVNNSCTFSNFTSYGATNSNIMGCSGFSDDDVWFKFTATNSVQNIIVEPSENMDPVVEVFSGTCGSLTSIYCIDDGFMGQNESATLVGLIPGQTYYVRVYDYYNSTGGFPFQICIYGPTTSTPVNDECTTAIELPTVTSKCQYYYFTNNGATYSSTTPFPSNCENWDGSPNNGGFGTSSKDVWFKIKVPNNGIISIRPAPDYGISDLAFALYSGNCSNLTLLQCSDDHNYPGTNNDLKPYILVNNLTPGTYVYLRVWGFGSAVGDFGLCVESPTNDFCNTSLDICDLDGYSGSTSSAYTIDRPCNMRGNAEMDNPPDYTYTPGTCQGGIFGAGGPWGQGAPNCDVRIDNNSWIQFTAASSTISLNVNISDCWVGNYPSGGIQMQIFEGENCCNFVPASDFKENSTSFTLTANNLIPGKKYYLMIDGFAGDICDYTIQAITGVQFTEITASSTDICFGQSVTLTAPSGASSYLWTPGGQTTQSITVSPSTTTTYMCEVTGVCGDKHILYKTIHVHPIPNVVVSNSGPICEGNTLSLYSSGGVFYSWSGPQGFTSNLQNPVISNVSTSNSGTYYVTVTTQEGCSSTGSTNVTIYQAPSTPSVSATSNPICSGSSTTINATATGAVYYNVYAQESGNSFIGTTPLTVSPTITTTYYIEAVSANGCVHIGPLIPITITVNPSPNATASNNGPLCTNQTLQLFANGGISYYWSGPNNFTSQQQNPTINNVQEIHQGTYYVTVTNSYGCSATASTTVYISNSFNTSINPAGPFCVNSGPQTLTAATPGGIWSGPGIIDQLQGIFDPNIAGVGNHTISYTITGECGSTSFTTITVYDAPTAIATSNSPICEGQQIQLFANNITNATYLWNGPQNFISTQQNPTINNATILNSGPYYLTITDQNNCTATSMVNVIVNPKPQVSITSNNPVCSGSTLNVHATPGYSSYVWSGPNNFTANSASFSIQNVNNSHMGFYTVTVTNSSGCTNSSSIYINVLSYTAGQLNVLTTSPKCHESNDGSILVNISGGTPPYTYTWSHDQNLNSNLATNLNQGYYGVTVTDGNNCNIDTIIYLNAPPQIIIQPTIQNVSCYGYNDGNIYIEVTGGTPGYTFLWNNNFVTQNLTNVGPAIYSITVTDANGCTSSLTNLEISQPSKIQVFIEYSQPKCPKEIVNLNNFDVEGGTPPYEIEWSSDSIPLLLIQGTPYSVTITDKNNCKLIHSFYIHKIDEFNNNFQIQIDSLTCLASIINNPSGGTPPYTYNWNTGNDSKDLHNIESGLYIVTITDNNNCVFIDTFIVKLPLLIPNFITPNNDGLNDRFYIRNIHTYEKVKIEIYTRWGEKIFTFNGSGTSYTDPSKQWDGTYNNKILNLETFIYTVIINDKDVYKGTVTVLK